MSLVGTSILHIANRLGDMKKEEHMTSEGEIDLTVAGDDESTTAPPTPAESESSGSLKFRLFKDSNNTYTTVPSTSVNRIIESIASEAAQRQTPPTAPDAADIATVVSQMQQHQQLAANQQLMMSQEQQPSQEYVLQSAQQPNEMNMSDPLMTVKDILPGYSNYSPWLRNAGRKKSHPVWDFFKDLKDTNGVGGVICLHCSWSGDDRSPNNLRTHLKKFHASDGIFAKFSEKLAQTPTQPYVKRARANPNSSHGQLPGPSDSVTLALQQLQNAANQQQNSGNMSTSLNFLDSIPKSNEVINVSAGFAVGQEEDEAAENANEPGSSGASASGERAVSNSPVEETSGGSPSVTSTNQLNAFMNMAANPLMWNAMLANSSHGSAFTINDGQCVSMMMKMAIDLELTMSYHKRRGDIELCFESNRTAEKSGGRGKVLCLSDLGREIRVIERVNGTPTDTELWTKTDFNQFHWAIRGKCQKSLLKG